MQVDGRYRQRQAVAGVLQLELQAGYSFGYSVNACLQMKGTRNDMSESRIPIRFAVFGLVCFIISLNMPSFELALPFIPVAKLDGLQLSAFTLGFLSQSHGMLKFTALGLIGAINSTFVITPLAISRRATKILLLPLCAFVLVGFMCTVYVYVIFNNDVFIWIPQGAVKVKFVYGYFLWSAGYVLQIVAISYWLWDSRDKHIQQASEAPQERVTP